MPHMTIDLPVPTKGQANGLERISNLAVASPPRGERRVGVSYPSTCAPATGPFSAHEPAKLLEQVTAVVRPRRRLRVVLNAEDRHSRMPHPFERPIIQVNVRQLHVLRQTVNVYGEAMVLGRDLDRKSVV